MDKDTYIQQATASLKKGMLIVAVLLVVGIVAFPSILNDLPSKKRVFALVNENHALLWEAIWTNEYEKALAIKGIQNVHVYDDAIEFYCGGSGMGSQTRYRGFYYSADNTLSGLDFCRESGLSREEKGFSYYEKDGDNSYYTEKIRDNFFYYEAQF